MHAPSKTFNIVNETYKHTGSSKTCNALGMREMQARAYQQRGEQYLLIKSPPASGKSRALMFIALDKIYNQGINKVIIAVPEMSIGRSFSPTPLKDSGFFADWHVSDKHNLCVIDGFEAGKTDIFVDFMLNQQPDSDSQILICTHHSFRFGFDALMKKTGDLSLFDNTLIGIDEFHHVAADDSNRLGTILDAIMSQTSAHIIAMTGSYFRGDQVPILTDEVEARFSKVTYTYYEQLNGYEHLKSLGLGYHFYKRSFFDALKDCLDTRLKTIIHIPNVNSSSAEIDKYETVSRIIDVIGEFKDRDEVTGIMYVETNDGRMLKVADLVTDNHIRRNTQSFLSKVTSADDVDIIIALGMAQEGFDWEYCEHALTIGYRGSLTEVVQIIGRATRDSEGKSHAQFTNLIAEPDSSQEEVEDSVNNLLKAITLSLLMEQVLKPNINFKRRSELEFLTGSTPTMGTIIIDDSEKKPSDRIMNILNNDKEEILSQIYQKPENVRKFMTAEEAGIDPEVLSTEMLKEVFGNKYPDLPETDVYQAIDAMMHYMAINAKGGVVAGEDIPDDAEIEGERLFVKQEGVYVDVTEISSQLNERIAPEQVIKERYMPINATIEGERDVDAAIRRAAMNSGFIANEGKFINVNNLPYDLIASVNPFHDAYEVLSRALNKQTLGTINDDVAARRSSVSEDEAVIVWPKIVEFKREYGREPSSHSNDPVEQRMAQVLHYVRSKYAEHRALNQR